MREIRIFDGVLQHPLQYRDEVLQLKFKTYDFGASKFHGIAIGGPAAEAIRSIRGFATAATPTLTFFRKSPLGQKEPHYIHTDVDMGDWTAILYLNPDPPKGDGTSFWTHRSGTIESAVPFDRIKEGHRLSNWTLRQHVEARFNRLLMFPASYFHSRSIPENYGAGDTARLIQVAFGKGEF